ncbi:hypothetical protein QTP86_001625 [Hemibagrus guttatus]|nr:hypothetical protein QTP86_001625 [Hemibagrus guttatus]
MKCFKRLIRDFITSTLSDALDPLQYAYLLNHSTEDTIAHLHHTALSHLDSRKGNYVKMLFVDYSSAFNMIIPSVLTTKVEILGLSPPLCRWISNFLKVRPQAVWAGKHVSPSLTLTTGALQGCVLSPLLYSLYTYDCVATSSSTSIKFVDNTAVVGLISNNDKTADLEEIKKLETWFQDNKLLLNVSKTKELIVDFSIVESGQFLVGCELEEKERFWSELDEVMESIHTGERVVIGADFNGHVGEGNTGDEEVMGKFGVKERNLEGQMVVDFAKRMDMAVVNTEI